MEVCTFSNSPPIVSVTKNNAETTVTVKIMITSCPKLSLMLLKV